MCVTYQFALRDTDKAMCFYAITQGNGFSALYVASSAGRESVVAIIFSAQINIRKYMCGKKVSPDFYFIKTTTANLLSFPVLDSSFEGQSQFTRYVFSFYQVLLAYLV